MNMFEEYKGRHSQHLDSHRLASLYDGSKPLAPHLVTSTGNASQEPGYADGGTVRAARERTGAAGWRMPLSLCIPIDAMSCEIDYRLNFPFLSFPFLLLASCVSLDLFYLLLKGYALHML